MSVSLGKGGNVSLSKAAINLTRVTVGLGWRGAEHDLDASALMIDAGGKVLSGEHFVFYGNGSSPDGSVVHGGDEKSGGDGAEDDERIEVDLARVTTTCQKVVFPVSIHEADLHGQSFGQVSAAYIRVVNADDGVELTRYDLAEDASAETAMVFGELYRREGEWRFRAIGQGYASGLRGIAVDYGVDVE